jgi:hypothetical protein
MKLFKNQIIIVKRDCLLDGKKFKTGMIGVVKNIYKDELETRIGTEWEKNVYGHNGNWGGKLGHCWWVNENDLLENCVFKNINLQLELF